MNYSAGFRFARVPEAASGSVDHIGPMEVSLGQSAYFTRSDDIFDHQKIGLGYRRNAAPT